MSTERPDIFEQLQLDILEGRLRPGDRLKEAEVAERFGTSRTPVREALRRLETRGLLVHEPHKGMVIAQLEASAVAELYVMREILDAAAAGLAAQHATETEIAAMDRQIARDREIQADAERLAASNRAFHLAMYRAAHNRFLLKSSNALSESLALLGPTTLAISGRGQQSIDEHEEIVRAVKRRDADAAREAASRHIRRAFEARLMQLDSQAIEQHDTSGKD